MKRRNLLLSFIAAAAMAASAAIPAVAADLVVFAAASMKGPLDKVAAAYEAGGGSKVVISYASSAQLAKPITPPGPGATYEISTLGFLTGSGVVGDVYDMNPPPASITDHLFGDGESDLNADQESFFRDFLSPSRTLEGFPYKDVKPQWWKNTDCTN